MKTSVIYLLVIILELCNNKIYNLSRFVDKRQSVTLSKLRALQKYNNYFHLTSSCTCTLVSKETVQ